MHKKGGTSHKKNRKRGGEGEENLEVATEEEADALMGGTRKKRARKGRKTRRHRRR